MHQYTYDLQGLKSGHGELPGEDIQEDAAGGEPTPVVEAHDAPWDLYLQRLGLYETSAVGSAAYEFSCILTTAPCGVIHYMGGILSKQKATCKCHKRCVAKIRPKKMRDDPIALLRQLTEWLAHGRDTSRQQHLKRAYDIKLEHGMKPKPLTGE